MAAAKKHGTNGSRAKAIPLKSIRLDGDTQSRKELNEDVIKEYADLMLEGVEFPPLTVVFDGSHYWLVDGFHRRFSAIKAKLDKFKCLVTTGTREDARWLSYGANKDHGLPRSNPDKAKATISALKHPKGAGKADSKIAEHVGVSVKTVSKYRDQLQTALEIPKVTEREGRDGKTYDTANIGKQSGAGDSIRQEAMQRMREAERERQESKKETADFVKQYPPEQSGPCPHGGEHTYDEEACTRCHDPKPADEAPVGKLFSKLLEHLRQCTLLLDEINRAAPNETLRTEIFNSLEVANEDVHKWRKSAKYRS